MRGAVFACTEEDISTGDVYKNAASENKFLSYIVYRRGVIVIRPD